MAETNSIASKQSHCCLNDGLPISNPRSYFRAYDANHGAATQNVNFGLSEEIIYCSFDVSGKVFF